LRTEKFDEKRNSFKMLLFKLALSQMTLSSNKEKSAIYLELERIYAKDEESEDFRHFYSDMYKFHKNHFNGNRRAICRGIRLSGQYHFSVVLTDKI
jgi:hypothetical protein